MHYEVTSHYNHIMIKERMKILDKYLDNIQNSASTINRVKKYYNIQYSADKEELQLYFKNKIIRRYGVSKNDYYDQLMLEIWTNIGLPTPTPPIVPPVLIKKIG